MTFLKSEEQFSISIVWQKK